MHFVTFVVTGVFLFLSAVLFISGLANLHMERKRAHGLITGGFQVGVWGIVIGAVLFGFFNL